MADEQAQHLRADGSLHDQATPPPPAAAAAAAAAADSTAHDHIADDSEEKAAPATERADDDATVAQPALVTVNLKFIHHERLSVQCPPGILVAELKTRVLDVYSRHVESEQSSSESGQHAEAEQPPTGSLRLIYKGKVLKDDQSLSAYSFVHDDTIHAVFGRPAATSVSPAVAGAGDASSESASSPSAGSAAPATATSNAASSSTGVRGAPHNQMDFNFNLDEGAPRPDFGNFISSLLSSLSGETGGPELVTASFPLSMLPSSGGSASNGSASTAGTSTAATTTTGSASSTAISSSASVPSASSVPTPAASVALVIAPALASSSTSTASSSTTPASITAVRYSIPLPAPPRPAPVPNLAGNATSLLNQAATLRRMIPALELSPLSQPPGLSTEAYALGNALREAGDTFLAVHRQLQFVATRFLSENNLNTSERQRLRTRVHQLVSILEHVSTLTRSVSSNLAASSFGPGAQAPPLSNQSASPQQPSTTTSTTTPSVRPTASVSVSPTVDIFSGGNGQGASAPSIGNSIAEVLQVVNSLRSGAVPATASASISAGATPAAATAPTSLAAQPNGVPGSLGSLLNLVSALTSSGARAGASPAPPAGPSSQGFATSATQSQPPVSVPSAPSGYAHTPASPSQQTAAGTASIPARPLSALFAQVMRDMDTLDEWDPETVDNLLKRVFPHLRHRVRALFGSAGNTTAYSLRHRWWENVSDEIESAMRRTLESHGQVYESDRLRLRINEVMLEHLLDILLDSNAGDLQDQDHINASLEKLRKLMRKFCTALHADISEQTSPIEAVRIASSVVSSVLTTEDLSVRRSAEGLASRVNREATSFLKTRTA